MQTVDNDLALKIYIKARATPKVVAAFAERREFDKILIYSKQVIFLLYPFVIEPLYYPYTILTDISFSTNYSPPTILLSVL